MRSFVAIALPENTLDALCRVQARLPVGPLVSRDNLHLTLAFLDDQPLETLELLNDELELIRSPSFSVQLSGLGCFGGDRTRLVFASVVPNPALESLQKWTSGAARRAGIVLKKRRFHPHVTLARPRAGAYGAGQLQDFVAREQDLLLPAFSVRGITLFRSDLRPEGAVYEVLATYDLTQQ